MTGQFFIGIDPGQSGGAALLDAEGQVVDVIKFKGMTDHDIASALNEWGEYEQVKAMLEKVSAMPKQGVSSTFKFGDSYGFLRGSLVALGIPFDLVIPNRWQKALECQTKGDKNISKSRAQRQWPRQKITHAIADALLIAEYARQVST